MADEEKKLKFTLVGDNSSLKNSMNEVNGTGSTLKSTMAKLGVAMAGAFAVKQVIDFGKEIAKVGGNFESQMSKVTAIGGDNWAESMDEVIEKAKEMGSTTVFSATEAGEGLQYFAMAGWDAEASMSALEPTLRLAQASGTALGVTADIVSDAITAFGLSAEDTGMFTDLLASTTSSANTNVTMLGESFKYVAPVMGALGGKAEDTALALGLMANAGIKGSMAGTSLKTAVSNLVAPTDQMKEAMDGAGIAVQYNADGSMNLKGTMDNLRLAMGEMTKEQQAVTAETIFGKEAMSGMLSIVNATTEDYGNLTKATTTFNGVAQKQADIMGNNLNGRIAQLKSAWEGVQLMLYTILLPTFELMVDWLMQLVEWISTLSTATTDDFGEIGEMASALGKWFMNMYDIIYEVVMKVIKVVQDWFKDNDTQVSNMIRVFKSLAKSIGEIVAEIWDFISWLVSEFGGPLLDKFMFAIDVIFKAFDALLQIVAGVVKVLVGIFTGDWAKVWEGMGDIVVGVWTAIVYTIETAINSVITMVNKMIRSLNKIELPDFLGGGGVNISTISKVDFSGALPTTRSYMPDDSSVTYDPSSQYRNTQSITVELDGNKIAEAVGDPMAQAIRVQTGYTF